MVNRANRINELIIQLEAARLANEGDSLSSFPFQGLVGVAERWQGLIDAGSDIGVFEEFGVYLLSEVARKVSARDESLFSWPVDNWGPEANIDLDAALGIASTGIPLAWIPSARLVSKLQDSSGQEREYVLVSNLQVVSEDCIAVLSKVTDSRLQVFARMSVNAAVDLAGRNMWAAQALATNILNTLIRHMQPSMGLATELDAPAHHLAGMESQALRQLCVLTPVAAALTIDRSSDSSPTSFNLSATIHGVSLQQYSLFNALIAVMLVSSTLREAQESGW